MFLSFSYFLFFAPWQIYGFSRCYSQCKKFGTENGTFSVPWFWSQFDDMWRQKLKETTLGQRREAFGQLIYSSSAIFVINSVNRLTMRLVTFYSLWKCSIMLYGWWPSGANRASTRKWPSYVTPTHHVHQHIHWGAMGCSTAHDTTIIIHHHPNANKNKNSKKPKEECHAPVSPRVQSFRLALETTRIFFFSFTLHRTILSSKFDSHALLYCMFAIRQTLCLMDSSKRICLRNPSIHTGR